MSCGKLKTNSFCVGLGLYSSTINIEGDITGTGQKMLIVKCIKSNRKKSVTVNSNRIQAESLHDSLKNSGLTTTKTTKKPDAYVMESTSRALEIGAKTDRVTISRITKAVLNTVPEMKTVYINGYRYKKKEKS